jgi:16S rRNA (adenine1518-N6/adenine1519-N6)-dimethyltransferase
VLDPRKLLSRAGILPRKRYGQNFLVNASAARQIARLSLRDAAADTRVLEIGAGTGVLTLALLNEEAHLTALEIDPQLAALLRGRSDLAPVEIIEADALSFDYVAWSGGHAWRVAGNLPYNIATALLLRLIEMDDGPVQVTATIQSDVAERLVATPGTRQYGSLSVAVQYAMKVDTAFTLSPNSFFPPPKVQSSVVVLRRRERPAVTPRNSEVFWKVVRGAFAYRRKTLANSLALALGVDRATVAQALVRSSLSPELRGERLSLDDFARLADTLAEGKL